MTAYEMRISDGSSGVCSSDLLVPKDADGNGGDAPGVQIDPATSQALGLRTVAVRSGELASSLTATGTIDFNQRDVAIVQARAGGFVQRVYGRAPGDAVGAGAQLGRASCRGRVCQYV